MIIVFMEFEILYNDNRFHEFKTLHTTAEDSSQIKRAFNKRDTGGAPTWGCAYSRSFLTLLISSTESRG